MISFKSDSDHEFTVTKLNGESVVGQYLGHFTGDNYFLAIRLLRLTELCVPMPQRYYTFTNIHAFSGFTGLSEQQRAPLATVTINQGGCVANVMTFNNYSVPQWNNKK